MAALPGQDDAWQNLKEVLKIRIKYDAGEIQLQSTSEALLERYQEKDISGKFDSASSILQLLCKPGEEIVSVWGTRMSVLEDILGVMTTHQHKDNSVVQQWCCAALAALYEARSESSENPGQEASTHEKAIDAVHYFHDCLQALNSDFVSRNTICVSDIFG